MSSHLDQLLEFLGEQHQKQNPCLTTGLNEPILADDIEGGLHAALPKQEAIYHVAGLGFPMGSYFLPKSAWSFPLQNMC